MWLAEIMLQQTQVTTVIPYYLRFLERFPELDDLASADQDEVLALWAGLGYYARARNLHKTAKRVVSEYGGDLPMEPDELESLPGIGRSTARAIISQVTDQPLAILDGNVKRVLARHAGIAGWPGRSAVLQQLWAEADRRVPEQRGADYTQAGMDLGALLCTRSRPQCSHCPVSADCTAFQSDRVAELPTPRPRKERPQRSCLMLIQQNPSGAVLLERRPPTGIWGGLWCLPMMDSLDELELCGQPRTLKPLQHDFTHFRLQIQPVIVTPEAAMTVHSPDLQRFCQPDDWSELGLPRPVAKLLANLQSELKS